MRTIKFRCLVVLAGVLAIMGAPIVAAAGEVLGAHLAALNEVPTLATGSSGLFFGKVSADATSIDYILYYELESGTATAAHIHLGEPGVSGGIIAFLCGGGGKPACPDSSGSVSGTLQAADILGPTTQGVSASDFARVLRAIRRGAVYANVHTGTFPAGEIRGQIK